MGERFSTDAALRAQANDRTIARDHIPTIADDQARTLAWSARKRNGILASQDVAAMLKDPSSVVVRRGIEFAVDFDDIDLVGLLEGSEATHVEIAAFVLGERMSRRGRVDKVELAALQAVASKHDDALCREAAVAALGATAEHIDVGDPVHDATRLILWAALDDKAPVRRRAVIALSAFDDPESAARVRAAREDRDTQVQRIAKALTDEDRPDDSSESAQRR